MTDPLEATRKRLFYRAHHRGTKEMDLVLGSFAETHLGEYDAAGLERFAAVLEESDADFLNWVTGQAPVPADDSGSMIAAIVAFANERLSR
nr:succinate dehydrogenase assembly factor 2 [uncultured Sphaerochaeta sp.]